MVTTNSRKGRQLPKNGKRTLKKPSLVPHAMGAPRSSTARKHLEERAKARWSEEMSDSNSNSSMEATKEGDSEDQVPHEAAAGGSTSNRMGGFLLHDEDQESSEEDSDNCEEEGNLSKDVGAPAMESDPTSHLPQEEWSPAAAKKLKETAETLTNFSEMIEENGVVVETKVSLRVRVEKVGRDHVFDYVKFGTAMNVHLFVHSGIVMRMVCRELNLEEDNVNANHWAKMVRWVRKGLADRRNSTRSMLRTEIRKMYASAEYKRIIFTGSPSEMIGHYRLITLVQNCFLGKARMPDTTWKSLGEDEIENVKDYLKETVYPFVRRWWLTVAVRCGVRRRVWTSAMKQGWPISKVCRLSTEAYIMTVFDNNAAQWEAEFIQGMNPKSEGFPKSRFTGRLGRTSCLGFKGWNEEGIRAYNMNNEKIEGWRKQKVRIDLEKSLRSEFRGDANEAKRKKEAEERRILREKMEISVKPVDSMAEYEQWLDSNSGRGSGGKGDLIPGPYTDELGDQYFRM